MSISQLGHVPHSTLFSQDLWGVCQNSYYIRLLWFSLFFGAGWGREWMASWMWGTIPRLRFDALNCRRCEYYLVLSVSAAKQNKTYLHLCAKAVIYNHQVSPHYIKISPISIIPFYQSVIIERKPMTNFLWKGTLR